jgi:hypothetical protein
VPGGSCLEEKGRQAKDRADGNARQCLASLSQPRSTDVVRNIAIAMKSNDRAPVAPFPSGDALVGVSLLVVARHGTKCYGNRSGFFSVYGDDRHNVYIFIFAF